MEKKHYVKFITPEGKICGNLSSPVSQYITFVGSEFEVQGLNSHDAVLKEFENLYQKHKTRLGRRLGVERWGNEAVEKYAEYIANH